MNSRILITSCFIFWASFCSAGSDEWYYRLHPNVLQKELEPCFHSQKNDSHCQDLKRIAERVNALADELRFDPQAYGKKILALQEMVARPLAAAELNDNQRQLEARLAVVKWLESPER